MPQTKIKDDLFTKTWDLRGRNVRLPNDDHTHYYCQIFKAPSLESKHHMIGVRFLKYTIKLKDILTAPENYTVGQNYVTFSF